MTEEAVDGIQGESAIPTAPPVDPTVRRCPNCGPAKFAIAPESRPMEGDPDGERQNAAADKLREQFGALLRCTSCGYITRANHEQAPEVK